MVFQVEGMINLLVTKQTSNNNKHNKRSNIFASIYNLKSEMWCLTRSRQPPTHTGTKRDFCRRMFAAASNQDNCSGLFNVKIWRWKRTVILIDHEFINSCWAQTTHREEAKKKRKTQVSNGRDILKVASAVWSTLKVESKGTSTPPEPRAELSNEALPLLSRFSRVWLCATP